MQSEQERRPLLSPCTLLSLLLGPLLVQPDRMLAGKGTRKMLSEEAGFWAQRRTDDSREWTGYEDRWRMATAGPRKIAGLSEAERPAQGLPVEGILQGQSSDLGLAITKCCEFPRTVSSLTLRGFPVTRVFGVFGGGARDAGRGFISVMGVWMRFATFLFKILR